MGWVKISNNIEDVQNDILPPGPARERGKTRVCPRILTQDSPDLTFNMRITDSRKIILAKKVENQANGQNWE